jgi:predicted O-linked N-acetylglucosamine transferase (SPINDLY family)
MTRGAGTQSRPAGVPPLVQTLERAMQHQREGDVTRAEQLYRDVLGKEPANFPALHLLGGILLQAARNEDAAALLEEATARVPAQAVLFANLGEAHRRCGNMGRARESLLRAVALKPDLAEAHYTLGLVLWAEKLIEPAAECLERAIALKPSLLPAYESLSGVLMTAGRLDEAGVACERALAIDPGFTAAHNQLGVIRSDQGRIEDALACFRRILEIDPRHRLAHSNLIFGLPLRPGEAPASILREARRWEQQQLQGAIPRPPPYPNDRRADRRLRVGLVSPDFREHVLKFFLFPLLDHRDRQEVEIYCYSIGGSPDAVTERIRALADHFRDVARVPDAEAVEAIRRDRIDVLVDLSMHADQNRIALFAAKPAPVQVAWFSYPGTTGLSAMDYRLTDPWLDPPGTDLADYSEVSIHLPDTFWCYDPLTREPDVGPLPAEHAGRVTFGCLNRFCKTNPEVLSLWAQVVAAVPGSRMIVRAFPGQARERVRDAFARAGVDAERIEFVSFQPRDEYLQTYRRIDVALDTFPYNGHTTSLDAFWMGVPVVTLVGDTVVGRAGAAFARQLGLPELVAASRGQFVSAAVELARDVARLSGLRSELRTRMEHSPLMDGPRFARAFASALRTMWTTWCERPPPHSAKEITEHAVRLGLEDRDDEAIELLQRALETNDGHAPAHRALGMLLAQKSRWDDAIACFRRALDINPEHGETHHDLGHALAQAGFTEEAVASYRRAAELLPGDAGVGSALVYHTHFLPGYSSQAIADEASAWNRRHAEPLAAAHPRPRNERSPERRLRVGYVSPDFRYHCQALFTMPLLAHHNREQFEITCYSDVLKNDDWTENILRHADRVRSIVRMPDEAVAAQVRADRIDILVDLTMHMARNRLLVFARTPAPVQMSWLAYPGTTGMTAIDYRITDPVLDPPEDAARWSRAYAERSLHLEDTFWCYHPLTSEFAANPLPALANGYVRFGCLNAICKVNDAVIGAWSRVLRAVPSSRFSMLAPAGSARRRLLDSFASHGIEGDRIELLEYQPRVPYLATYRRIDVCLDTFPYNGHTTSLDGMWMGVPVVTSLGGTVVGRAGLCFANVLGMPELVARTEDEYVDIAVTLGRDLERLATIRAGLRARMEASPLMDAPRFARNLEALYRRAWRKKCRAAD